MNDTDDTISSLDDAIVEDGLEDMSALDKAEQSAARIIAFYLYFQREMPPHVTRGQAFEITIAWIRAGMP